MLLFDSDNLFRPTKMVKCLPEFKYFTILLKNRKIISKIRRSKITDYAALTISGPKTFNSTFLDWLN